MDGAINENLLKYDDIDEETIGLALPKIVKMYEKAKDGEVGIQNNST